MNKNRNVIEEIDIKYYEGKKNKKYDNIVAIFLGGSEGGFPKLFNFNFYRKLGLSCLSISYFKTKYSQQNFEKVDLNKLYNSIKTSLKEFNLYDQRIIVMGYSKGAELSLLLGSLFNEIKGVLTINPSNLIFQSPYSLLKNHMSSSWIYNGEEIPYVELDHEKFKQSKNKHLYDLYNKAFTSDYRQDAIIKVEKINGPILLLSGKEDIVWPSSVMSCCIIDRLKEYNFKFWNKSLSYQNAGHTFIPFYGLGGNFMGNLKARINMKKYIVKFLDEVNQLIL